MSAAQQPPKDSNASKQSEDPHRQTASLLRTALETLESMFNASSRFTNQLERWMPVLIALQKLARTSQKLGQYIYHFLAEDTEKTETHSILPLDLLAELYAGFTELVETFPDVASFFLDTEKIDNVLADILLDPANALPGNRLLKLANDQFTRAIGKFVELTMLSASEDTPSAESTHAFLKRAEHLLDSIVQRWIWPIIDPTQSANLPDEPTP